MLTRALARIRLHALLAATMALTLAFAAPVHAGDDEAPEENSGIDHQIFKSILTNLGIYNEGNEIDYRERSPLVVPPGRDLPPPSSDAAAVDKNPAWPIDPEVKRARALKKTQAQQRRSFEDESKPLPPDQLRGPPGAPTAQTGRAKDYENPVREGLSPSQSLWNSLFSKDEQVATFKEEPPRVSLTEPPPGYQTPSPNFPYGINTKEQPKAQPKALEIDRR